MTLTFTIPAPCEAITANQRLHFQVKRKRTAAWRARAHVAAIQAGRPKLERAHARVLVHSTTNRNRDVANWHPIAKAVIDGLVQDAHVLPDDSDRFLVGPDLRPGPKAAVLTLTVTLDDSCECVDCAERFAA